MKHNWWAIRHVLQELVDDRGLNDKTLHAAKLCQDAGFIRGLVVGGITSAGHDALAVLSDADALARVLDKHGEDLPWEVLRALLIRERWPEPVVVPSNWEAAFRRPQSRRCPLCEGTGNDPHAWVSTGTSVCPHCHGARIVWE